MEKIVVNNPIIDYFLAQFRDKETSIYDCNVSVDNISMFLAGEASKFLKTEEQNIITPLGEKICPIICEEVILVPVIRAGVSMLGAFQRLLPQSKTGFIWMHRDCNAQPVMDKVKFPKNQVGDVDIKGRTVFILDTMLATAGTVNATAELISKFEPKQILCISICSTEKGISNLSEHFSALVTASESDGLDENLYVYPGVGDAGDRLYG